MPIAKKDATLFFGATMILAYTLLTTPAQASQGFPVEKPLPEVLRRTRLIVLVEPASRAERRELLHVPGPKKVHPFEFIAERMRVLEVIEDPDGLAKKGAIIEVASGSLETDYQGHIEYYRDGISDSPFLPIYPSPVPHDPSPKLWIAMLRPCKAGTWDGLCYAVSNARELPTNLKKIEAAKKR